MLIGVGNLIPTKGFHRIIPLLPALKARFPTLRFLIVGGGVSSGNNAAELEALARSHDVADIVQFCGRQPHDALKWYYGAADVFAQATAFEGWSNVFLEAMACGLPVVTTRVGGNAEVVASDAVGTLVDWWAPDQFSAAIARALTHPWDQQAIIEYARANAYDTASTSWSTSSRRLPGRRRHERVACPRDNPGLNSARAQSARSPGGIGLKVTVIGTGYVGLVTGACLADMGNDVLCVDVDAQIDRLREGEIPIHEPGLESVVRRNVAAGRLRFTVDPAEGARFGLVQMIAVGTPPDEDGSADLKYVLAAARAIGRDMPDYRVIVNKHPYRSGLPIWSKGRCARRPDGTRRHDRIQRGVQSRIPEGRGRGDDYHEAGSRDPRGRGSARRTCAARALPAIPAQSRTHDHHVASCRRTHQVRGKRHVGHPDLVHE